MEHLKVKKWDAVIEEGTIRMYAVTADGRYMIPDAFARMCDSDHMAVTRVHSERPEMFGSIEQDYWVPLRT